MMIAMRISLRCLSECDRSWRFSANVDDCNFDSKLKKPTTAIKEEDAKGKGYGLRSSAEPSIQKPTARLASVAYRASQLPAGFAKITRDLKKENNLRKSGMTAMELAQMTLRQVEEDKQNAFDGDRDTTPSRLVVKPVNPAQEETDWSGTEPNESEGEGKGADAPLRKPKPKDPDAEDTKLANIPVWPGVWEDLKAVSILLVSPDSQRFINKIWRRNLSHFRRPYLTWRKRYRCLHRSRRVRSELHASSSIPLTVLLLQNLVC